MDTYGSHEGYLYNLHTCSSSEAKRMWKESIKNHWDHECAYCGSTEELTLDHVVPQCKGGSNHITNVICACRKCNSDKAHEDWIIWFIQQPFFTEARRAMIEEWMMPQQEPNPYLYEPKQRLYSYGRRNNRAY